MLNSILWFSVAIKFLQRVTFVLTLLLVAPKKKPNEKKVKAAASMENLLDFSTGAQSKGCKPEQKSTEDPGNLQAVNHSQY